MPAITACLHALAATLKRAWTSVASRWAAIQVERHGTYSVERLHRLSKYQRSTSLAHSLLVVTLTPLPCFAVVTLLDSIPLKSPSLGLEHSQLFWLRGWLGTLFMNIAVMVQLRQIIVRLCVTTAQIVWIATVVSLSGTATAFGLACLIGYPLPFALVLGSPGVCAVFPVCFVAVWGSVLRSNPEIRKELVDYFLLIAKQVVMVVIYQVFSYVFNRLESYEQAAFALVLPLMKLALKNWISSSITQVEDFKPEMIIFNVEVFHALYVAYSMQTATSRSTIAVLMVVDFFHACASLCQITLSANDKRLVDSLSVSERREAVERVLQLLHVTEFVVLVEFTEVMIPVIYCLYLLVMSDLPNRVYYAQVRDLDDAKLRQNILNILLYASLELASFLVLSWFLGKKLMVSSLHQLAFVLESQWQLVQSKLVLWVLFLVQSSLEHFGADYSFRFKWLRTDRQA